MRKCPLACDAGGSKLPPSSSSENVDDDDVKAEQVGGEPVFCLRAFLLSHQLRLVENFFFRFQLPGQRSLRFNEIV